MRVAVVCPTVGQTRRGYERFITDLVRLLDDEIEMTVFKGGGAHGPNEKALRHLSRTGLLSRTFPNRLRRARHNLEFVTFALALLPHLAGGRFDLVHFIDPPLGRLLHVSRRIARERFGLLFTNAFTSDESHCFECSQWADHVHCLTPAVLEQAVATGIPSNRLTMLPVGTYPRRFATPLTRDELRRRYDVSRNTFVVLSVTSLNRYHKRVDYLIEEAARLDGDMLLWIDGSLEPDGDRSLLGLASSKLASRCRITHVPSDRVGELFALADVMVSTSLHESFGMSVVEAMCSGLPVVTHDSPHFRWLVSGAGHRIDMQPPGSLTAALRHFMDDPADLRRPVDPEGTARRFAWAALKAGYVEMYRHAAASATTATGRNGDCGRTTLL